jgi:two-component system sensor histidine kinase/response regulator
MPARASRHIPRNLARTLSNAIHEAVPVGLCLVDARGCVISLNPEGARLLDRAEADCLGRSLHELIDCRLPPFDTAPTGPEHDAAQTPDLANGHDAPCPIAQVLETGLPAWAPQATIRLRDGRWAPVEYKCIPLLDPDATGALFSFRDRSVQVQMEQDLRRLASIPEESPFPIVELDEEGHLLYANRTMLRLLERFGYTDQGFPVILPDNLTALARECVTAQVCIEPVEVTVEGLCYLWTLCAIPACRRLRAYGTDLTEVRRTERTMRNLADMVVNKNIELDLALTKAEEAAQVKARFLATMSHEIRTPLNGVIGMLELLQDGPLSSEQSDFIGTARRSAEMLMGIINDILDFSKIEAGKLDLEALSFDLPGLVEDVVGLLAEQASRKGVEVNGLIAPDVPAAVQGDAKRLRQVLTNLVGNAVKFTARGEVAVRVERDTTNDEGKMMNDEQRIKEDGSGIHHSSRITLRFSVSDTGIGIPTAQQAHLFQPFAQADSSTTRKYGGTGLGLAISKQLVELMGGTIGLENEPGQGCTFWFTVALQAQPVQPQPAATPLPPHSRVLIVAGSDTMRLLLRQHLSAWRLTDICEDDGPHAMILLRDAAARGRPFTIAIVDHNLHGPCDVAAIIADPTLTATSVLLLTQAGQGSKPIAHEGARLACLSKPVRLAALHRQLTLLLNNASCSALKDDASPAVSPAAPSGARLLVVEDNEVNQVVAVRLLQKLGYQADVAANGCEALAALERTSYAGILMDCHMPEMDGYEATRRIREREAYLVKRISSDSDEPRAEGADASRFTNNEQRGTQRVPIIAMTVNCLPGDREQCLAAGMDDYLVKPVSGDALCATLSRWVPPADSARKIREASFVSREAQDATPASSDASRFTLHEAHAPAPGKSVFNRDEALTRQDGDAALLQKMANLYLQHYPQMITELQEALAKPDYEQIARTAHRVKGMVGNFCAWRAAVQAAQLEDRGRQQDQEAAVQACRELADELVALAQALTAFLQEDVPCKS